MARQRGSALIAIAVVVLAALAAVAALAAGSRTWAARRDEASDRALREAREALVAYAADRPIDTAVGPGYLPCPDRDNDGWAESTCGSLTGHLGQEERLGRLPWKTLGLPDVRDGHGERLWYAVSTRHKGLLNCAASPACTDMSPPAALGTITVRDATGAMLHDGRRTDTGPGAGAAAVVIAPGPPLARAGDGRPQERRCPAGQCDARGRCTAKPARAAATCDPANYLDVAPEARFAFEDNADFHDRSDAARGANGNGFIAGPVTLADGRLAVNDRLAVVPYAALMPRVMARVALETAHCLRAAHPAPTPACGLGEHLGRVPDASLGAAGAGCAARADPGTWWAPWQPHVLYARGAPTGLEVAAEDGRVLASGRRFALLVTREPGDCAPDRLACGAGGCTRVVRRPPSPEKPHAMVAIP